MELELYTEFLLQTRNLDSWISRLPNDLIKNIAGYMSTAPSVKQIMQNPDKWNDEKRVIEVRVDSVERDMREKEIKRYMNEELPKMKKRAGFQDQWMQYDRTIDGHRCCMVDGQCSEKPAVVLIGTRFAQCAWHELEEVLPAIEQYYEDRKKPMNWDHVDSIYHQWCQ